MPATRGCSGSPPTTGVALEAVPIDRSDEILRLVGDPGEVDLVAVDEVQFLDAGIVEVATHLAERGVQVILAGTDTDFRGEPFGMMGHLMAIAEDVTKLQAICVICGDLARRNQRLVNGRPAGCELPDRDGRWGRQLLSPLSQLLPGAATRRGPGAVALMRTLALTGNIAAGKSTVARLLREWGAVVFDADETVRELQRPGQPVFAAILGHFGPAVLRTDGGLDRDALRRRILADPAARAALEQIVRSRGRAAATGRTAGGDRRRDDRVRGRHPVALRIRGSDLL